MVVDEGFVALYILDGAIENVYSYGRYQIDLKSLIKNSVDIKLVAINATRLFELKCGISDIPLSDSCTVSAHGKCNVSINDARALYLAYGDVNITVDVIEDNLRGLLKQTMSTALAKSLLDYPNKLSVIARQSDIAQEMSRSIVETFADKGLELAAFVLEKISFSEKSDKTNTGFGASVAVNRQRTRYCVRCGQMLASGEEICTNCGKKQ